ncbi:MAG: winged helix DNA-binding domain-containing protein [Candidatus Nanopelagicales bacterium]
MRHVSDDQRRIRLAVRHGLHPEHQHPDVVSATTAMTVLHATEPASVYLSLVARVGGVAVDDVASSLFEQRTLVKQLAMRRTLFVFPRDLLPAAWGSAAARVAGAERRRLAADLGRAGFAADAEEFLTEAAGQVLARLADGQALDAATLRAEIPQLQERIMFGSGRWAQEGPIAPRVLTWMGARGELVRGGNAGHWRVSRPLWTPMQSWLGDQPRALPEAAGYAELLHRWLFTFGPGTESDLVWWFGATKSAIRAALSAVGAVNVALDSGEAGWVLPGDDQDLPEVSPWAALLPTLDPTTMGWKQRGFYLAPADVPFLFDSAGNAGTTAWWNGRVVGCWVQDPNGVVRVVLRGDPGAAARQALDDQARRLTGWLAGQVVGSVYSSAQMRGDRLISRNGR